MRLRDRGEFGILEEIIAELAGEDLAADEQEGGGGYIPSHGESDDFLGQGGGRRGEKTAASIVVGPGDDAAAIDFTAASSPGDLLLLAADMMVEGTHFLPVSTLSIGKIRDVGYKSVAVNISDIAAMAGTPSHILISIAAPGDMEVDRLKAVMAGARQCAGEFGARIIGGDLTRSPLLTISVSITGRAPGDKIARRDGARPGDLVLVTGTVGDSAAGLSLISGKDRPTLAQDDIDYLIDRHMRPSPRVAEGAMLAAAGVRTMIDISDGLLQDLGHICEKSGVAARVDSEAVPVSFPFIRWVTEDNREAVAANGGEDYELIAVCPPDVADFAKRIFEAESATDLSVVGVIIEPQEGAGLVDAGQVTSEGWDSFSNG